MLRQTRIAELIGFAAAGGLAGLLVIEAAYRVNEYAPLVAAGGIALGWLAVTRPVAAVYAAVALIPLEVLPLPLGDIATLSPAEAGFALAGLGWVARRLLTRQLPYVASPLSGPLILMLLAVIVSYTSAPASLPVTKAVVIWGILLLVYFLLVDEGTPETVRGILVSLACSGAVVGAVALVGSSGVHQELTNLGATARGRAIGSFTQPNVLAAFLAVSLPGAVVLAIRAGALVRAAMAASLVLISVGLALSLSRGGLLAAAGALVVLVTWRPLRRLFVMFVVAFVGLATFNANPLGSVQQVDTVTDRVESVQYAPQLDPRLDIWTTTPKIIGDHLFFGVGAASFVDVAPSYGLTEPGTGEPYDHAHNVPLTVGAELGLLGLMALVWLLVGVTRVAIRALRRTRGDERALAVAVTAALVALALQGLVDYTIRSNPLAAVMLCLFASTVILSGAREPSKPPLPPDTGPSSLPPWR